MKTENFIIDVNVDIRKRSSQTLGITLMSQDINNYTFSLKLLQDGELIVTDDSYEVEVLSLFTTSKTSRLVKGTIKTHQVEWVFDTSYISKSEAVKNYVYVRKDGELLVSADANCFIFNVGLSEIDKGASKVAETYDENYQRYLDEFKEVADFTAIQQAEADRESAETTRISNEDARKSAEVIRIANEAERINAENVRSEFYEGFDGRLGDLEYDKVVLKNLIANGDFSNGKIGWSSIGGSTTAESNILSLTATGGTQLPRTYTNIAFVSGRKYYLSLRQRVTNSVANSLGFGTNASVNTVNSPIMNQWYENSVIFDATTDNQILLSNAYADGATASGKVMQVKSVISIDLTATFGAGNEPSKEWMDRLIEQTGYFDEYILDENWQVGELLRLDEVKANKQQEGWITPTLSGRITGVVKYRLNSIGLLEIRADVSNIVYGATIFTLPNGYRPIESIIDVVSMGGVSKPSGLAKLLIGTSGVVQIHGTSDRCNIDKIYRVD